MPLYTDRDDPIEPVQRQCLTATELDELIWDIAVGRPTRVELDTESKRATFFAVQMKIQDAVAKWRTPDPSG